MAKRFTDTEKWKKSFFRNLQAPYKLVWLYLLDDCDHAGVWNVEFDVMKLRTGIPASQEEILSVFEGRIIPFDDNTKWFVPDFIEFQYGELNPENRAHNSVIALLNKYKIKGLTSPLQGAMDKDKDKDKEKEERKEYEEFISMFNQIMGKNYRVDKKSRGQFNARMKEGFTIADFETAINNIKSDKFHKEKGYKHATPEFITRPDKFQQWLNAASVPQKKKYTPAEYMNAYVRREELEVDKDFRLDWLDMNGQPLPDWFKEKLRAVGVSC